MLRLYFLIFAFIILSLIGTPSAHADFNFNTCKSILNKTLHWIVGHKKTETFGPVDFDVNQFDLDEVTRYYQQIKNEKIFNQAHYSADLEKTLPGLSQSEGRIPQLNSQLYPTVMLSSETGREPLKAIRIALNRESMSHDLLKDYLNVMKKMPELELFVSYKKDVNREIFKKIDPALKKRVNFLEEPFVTEKGDGLIWAQDGSKPMVAQTYETLATTKTARPEHETLLELFQGVEMIRHHKSDLYFEGGDVVVGDHHIFMGGQILDQFMAKMHSSRKSARQFYESKLGKPIIEIGTVLNKNATLSSKIDFHTDLTLAVAYHHTKKKEVVLLGSFQALLDQLKTMPVSEFKTDREKNLLKLLFDQNTIYELATREAQVEALEKLLVEKGYEVLKVPNVIHKNIPWLNYTNVIFSENKVIFPDHDILPLDQIMTQKFKELGYEAIPVKVVQESALKMGGIRCLSETYRHPYAPIPKN